MGRWIRRERERVTEGLYACSVKHMMFGFGDEAEPLDETAALMEDMVVEYVHSMVRAGPVCV